MQAVLDSKTCNKCGILKTIDSFGTYETDSKKRGKITRSRRICNQCRRESESKRYRENPLLPIKLKERSRREHLKRKYNLAPEEYDELIKKSGGKCGICGREAKPPCVDHNHVTGKVRGILCYSCNFAIGLLKEDMALFKKCINYLMMESEIASGC